MLILFFTIALSSAQTQDNLLNNGVGFGLQINQFQKDFGLGFNLTSPYLAGDKLAVRLKGNLMYNENVQNSITTWTPYSNLSLGLVGVSGKIGDFIRLYGEGGAVGLFPSQKFSSEKYVFGGYGLFGFEFFMNKSFNYFIEIGGVGTGAVQDKMALQPIYSNGLLIESGFRVHLR